MHVIFRESHGLDEAATPTDLGQSPADLVVLAKEAVLTTVTVTHVAHDGVTKMRQVQAELVRAAGVGTQLDQAVARARVAPHRERKLDGGQASQIGDGRMDRVPVRLTDRRVDVCRLGCPAAHERQVTLGDLLGSKGGRQRGRYRRIEREHQDARGTAIEAMHGIDPLPQLVAQALHHHVAVTATRHAMHQHPGGLLDCHQVHIAMQHGQGHRAALIPHREVEAMQDVTRPEKGCRVRRCTCGVALRGRAVRRRTCRPMPPRHLEAKLRPGLRPEAPASCLTSR